MNAERLHKALRCVATRLRMFNKDGLREPQKRWIVHTLEIADDALRVADSEIEEDVRRMLGADDNGKEVRRGD